jgi:hypothetical protein
MFSVGVFDVRWNRDQLAYRQQGDRSRTLPAIFPECFVKLTPASLGGRCNSGYSENHRTLSAILSTTNWQTATVCSYGWTRFEVSLIESVIV